MFQRCFFALCLWLHCHAPAEFPRGKAALSRMSLELLLLAQLKGNWEVLKEEETAAPSRASRDKWKCRVSKSSQDDPMPIPGQNWGKTLTKEMKSVFNPCHDSSHGGPSTCEFGSWEGSLLLQQRAVVLKHSASAPLPKILQMGAGDDYVCKQQCPRAKWSNKELSNFPLPPLHPPDTA